MSSPGAQTLNEKEDLYDSAPCGFHSLDQDDVFIHLNETELRWLGYSRDELIGKKKIYDLLAPDSIRAFSDAFRDFKLHGDVRDLEMRLLRKDGSILPVLMSANAIRDLQGMYVMSHSILCDITGNKRSRQMFRGLLAAIPDPMVAIDGDGRIALANGQAEKMFGYTREELLDQKIEMLIPEGLRSLHEGHRTGYRAQPEVRPMGAGLELYGRRKDGEEFSVEISLGPYETEEGPLVLCTIRDTTARMRMVNALHTSEERFRVALKNSPVVLFNHDRELRYTWINAPVLDWAEQDWLGHTDAEILGAEAASHLTAIKQGVVRTGIGTRTETALIFKSEAHHFDLKVEPLHDAQGVVVGITCSATDITPLKRVEAEVERLNRLRTQFLDMAVHDLRNPIGSILLSTDFLSDDVAAALTEEQFRVLSGIRSSSEFMLRLIDDFMDLTSIESGNLSLNRRVCDPRRLLERSVGFNVKLASRKQIHVRLHIEGALPQLSIDEERVEQVLNNLISNAAKFSPRGTTIEVCSAARDGGVLISVRDQGPGIPEAERHNLFIPFGRTSVRATAGERSTGLGLAISRKIVEGHGGHIWLESQVGVGSVFSFTLPG